MTKPVGSHLGRALDNGEQERTQTFIRALAKITDQLVWQYGYDKMPRSLEKKYAYAELLGPRGPVVCEDLISAWCYLRQNVVIQPIAMKTLRNPIFA